MANSVQNVNKINAGTCPHGCSPAACPICSGMGGGSRIGERPQKAGEMSYHQCAMIGSMMRAREARIEEHEKNLLDRAEAIKSFEQNLMQISEKISQFISKLSQNIMFKPIAFTLNITILPLVNLLKALPNFVHNIFNKFSQLKIDIQDKLNAIFGEVKAFIQKKMSEIVSSVKSKFESLFKIFKRNNTKDDETKIDEDKKIFRLKTFINKILRKNKDDSSNRDENKSGS